MPEQNDTNSNQKPTEKEPPLTSEEDATGDKQKASNPAPSSEAGKLTTRAKWEIGLAVWGALLGLLGFILLSKQTDLMDRQTTLLEGEMKDSATSFTTTLAEMKKQSKAMADFADAATKAAKSFEDTIDLTRAEMRPYIGVIAPRGADGKIDMTRPAYESVGKRAGWNIHFQNFGRLPAQHVRFEG